MVITTITTATMDRDITSRGLGTGSVDQAGLAPITAGLLRAGPQVGLTGEALALQVHGLPQVSATLLSLRAL